MPRLRALLWDHDGVIADTEGLFFRATQETLAELGVSLSESQYRELLLVEGRGVWHLVPGVDAVTVARLRGARNARYRQLLLAADSVIPGVLALLDRLAPHYRMAIVTGSERVHFDAIHCKSGIPQRFEFVLTREDYLESKPSPEPYLRALERLQLAPSECLVLEDSERGLRAAKAAGLPCWVLPSALTRGSDFRAADRIVSGLEELHALVPPPGQF